MRANIVMFSNLEKTFEKIGAELEIVFAKGRRLGNTRTTQPSPARLNIITKNGKEHFEIALEKDLANKVELSVLEVQPKDRHLVLLAKQIDNSGQTVTKDHFLCGHDERHLFVAAVGPVSTVAAAKASLKPPEILDQEVGLNTKKRNRRKTQIFKRQGEWFFIPADIDPDAVLVRKDEPLVRGRGSKPHMAQFAYRTGGETVKVCRQHPNGLTQTEYTNLIERSPRAKQYFWRDMQRNAVVYVKGRIKHADHATIVLDRWHRVMMNAERRSEAVAFLD